MKMLSLDDAIKAVTMLLDNEDDTDKIWSCDVINNLKNAPSVTDVPPVRHGRWVPVKAGSSSYPFWNNQCSACGWMTGVANAGSYKYCPECGEKMDGGENDD